MSAIASFTLLPKSKIDGLRKAATPKKSFFGAPKDSYHDYLGQYGQRAAEYDPSGYILATLLPYLKERHNIDLMRSDYDELGTFLSEERRATYFVFTDEHKKAYYDQLSPESFSTTDLCEYYNKFNAAAETEVGEPMMEGISAIQKSLEKIDANSVIIFGIV